MSARAIILSAGLGTRLRPLTDELPKPLVPLGDRPIAAHIATRLLASGISEVVLNTHHRADQFAFHIGNLGVKGHLVHEPEIRGTAGGIAGARALFGDAPIVAWNGDILADPPLVPLLGAAGSGLAMAAAPRARGEGTLGVDVAGHVVRLRGERFGEETSGADYLGIAALGADVLAALPDVGCLIADVSLPLLRRGGTIRTVMTTARWTDVGSLATYHAANLAWLERAVGPEGSWVHPTATVALGVTLRRSIVGEGASVVGQGIVERAVVWPGARATAPLRDVIVTTAGRQVRVP